MGGGPEFTAVILVPFVIAPPPPVPVVPCASEGAPLSPLAPGPAIPRLEPDWDVSSEPNNPPVAVEAVDRQ